MAEIQRDLDSLMHYNKTERRHHGCRLDGWTPVAAYRPALGNEHLPRLNCEATVPELTLTDQENAAGSANNKTAPCRGTRLSGSSSARTAAFHSSIKPEVVP